MRLVSLVQVRRVTRRFTYTRGLKLAHVSGGRHCQKEGQEIVGFGVKLEFESIA